MDELSALLSNPRVRSVHLDHKNCRTLGLEASVIMDTLLLAAKAGRNEGGERLFLSGTYPDDPAVKDMLLAAGILRSLEHPQSRLPDPEKRKVITFPLLRGNPSQPERSWKRDAAGTKIVEYFQRCLELHEVELTDQGVSHLADLVTEVLGNAEEHGGVWFAIGYYTQDAGSTIGTCHLVLFNNGPTIYETMSAADASEEIKARITSLAERHMNRGFFGFGPKKKWDAEALWTLYSLQQGVSSKLHELPSRGNGSVEVINAFARLAGPGRTMCILSGASYILFDGRYDLGETDFEGVSRKILAFNAKNNLEEPPDSTCVRALSQRYPGTIVSLRFPLNREHLRRLAGDNG